MNWQKKRFSESEDRATEVTQVKEERGKRIKKNELSLREIWETIKYQHTHDGRAEGREGERRGGKKDGERRGGKKEWKKIVKEITEAASKPQRHKLEDSIHIKIQNREFYRDRKYTRI